MFKKLKRAAVGADVPHEKATATLKAERLAIPAEVRIPMSMHIGAPAKAIVKKGDAVMVGTLIGEAGGFVSANIHSSVSGTVKAVEPFALANGRTCESVVITTDGEQTVDPTVAPPEVTDKASFLRAVRNCGLVGLGGAGFPTDVKLQPKDPVDTLLINASECEVMLTSDAREMLDFTDTVISGCKAVMKWCEMPNCVIGIEDNKPECVEAMCALIKPEDHITVKPLKAVYGTGAELILIEKCLGREVPRGGLPAAVGCIVMNVTSVSTLGKYLNTGMPLVERTITIDGSACARPCNVTAPVGTAVETVLAHAGVKEGVQLGKVIAGGGMMGPALADLSVPITKTSGGLLMFSVEDAKLPDPTPCIRCGRCVNYCPLGLEPVEIVDAYERKDADALIALHADYCFNCGSCTFVCPARRPVTQNMALAKEMCMNRMNELKEANK